MKIKFCVGQFCDLREQEIVYVRAHESHGEKISLSPIKHKF